MAAPRRRPALSIAARDRGACLSCQETVPPTSDRIGVRGRCGRPPRHDFAPGRRPSCRHCSLSAAVIRAPRRSAPTNRWKSAIRAAHGASLISFWRALGQRAQLENRRVAGFVGIRRARRPPPWLKDPAPVSLRRPRAASEIRVLPLQLRLAFVQRPTARLRRGETSGQRPTTPSGTTADNTGLHRGFV